MQINRQAFTLIELLVVVLIIGILAAVAIPQYQRAIYKSRATEAISVVKSLMEAQEVYFLANGEYTSNIAELDIGLQEDRIAASWAGTNADEPQKYVYSCLKTNGCIGNAANKDMPMLGVHLMHASVENQLRGMLLCSDYRKNDMANKICQSLGTFVAYLEGNGNYYRIN